MKQQETRDRTSTRKVKFGRMAGAIVALGGLSGLVLAEGTAGAATKVVVSTTKNPKLGTILVSGKTVYTLKPSKTACSTACLKIWPPLKLPKGVTKATAGKGVSASKLGTVRRNGALQVTYAGKPLYWFILDKSAGQVHGNLTDAWGKWAVVVTAKPAHSSSSSGSSSNSGSGGTTAGSGGAAF